MDWDLADLERDSEPSISSVVGGQKSRENCSVDLKLGRVDDFADRSLNNLMACATVSSSGPSKRARGINNSSQTIFCLVDGCKSNLSNCRDYHKRHKVCEVHAKTPKVTVGGQEQRFCQQCSRFHSLVEFDEVKRSCRKRLDGHNRRRRKRQPNSLSGTSNTFFPNYQGGTFSSYSQMLSPTPSNPTWAQPIKFEEDTLHARQAPLHYLDRQHLLPVLSARNYKTSKNFALRGTSNAIPSTSQPLSNTLTSSNSDCALSLLSLPNEPSGLGLSQMVQDDVTPMAQPFLSGLHFSINNNHGLDHYSCSQASNDVSSCSVMEDKQMGTPDLVSDGGDTNFHGVFHLGEGDSSRPVENEVSQTVPIFWLS